MKIDQKKLERQELGVHRFIYSKQNGSYKDCLGTINYCTGVGKTYTAILIMKYLFKHRDDNHFIILVPSENLKLQWEKQLNNSFTKQQLLKIEVFTIQKVVRNNMLLHTITLIADEAHEYTSDEYIKAINGELIVKQNMLWLTATVDSKLEPLCKELCPVIDIIEEREAIESGFISNFVEYNISIKLTEEEQKEYDKLTEIIKKNLSKFGKGGLHLANKCLAKKSKHSNGSTYTGLQFAFGWAYHNGWRDNLDLTDPTDKEINDLWNPHKIIGYAKNSINAIRCRKNLLYSCENKVKLTIDIINKFNNIKTIVFSQSTAFADKVGLLINEIEPYSAVVYHSQLQTQMLPSPKTGKLTKFGKVRLRKRALERIQKGLSRVMVTASSLDRGFDVEDIRLGVTASGTQNPTQYKQRGGRVKRKETLFSGENIVLIINIFVKDTKDEDWLKNRQSKSDHIIHSVDNIDDITFTPKSNFNIF